RVHHRRRRQYRRGSGCDIDVGGVAGRGRYRFAGHPRAVRQSPQRLRAHPHQLHYLRRRATGEAARDRRAIPRTLGGVRCAHQRCAGRRQRQHSLMSAVMHTTTVIIGAGQAGLAMSRCLSELGIEHVVLERGKLAQRWRSHSWDSLHLLTPNWMTRLPGFQYDGNDPNGFISVPELIAFFERYASSSAAPIVTDTTVERVERSGNHFRVDTDRGEWSASSVVVATGYCDLPFIPSASRRLAPSILQIATPDYRRPEQLPAGGVLVVGASSSGVQIADEIQRSGRQVTLAVGRHTRLPRHYRGRDILWWLDPLRGLCGGGGGPHEI